MKFSALLLDLRPRVLPTSDCEIQITEIYGQGIKRHHCGVGLMFLPRGATLMTVVRPLQWTAVTVLIGSHCNCEEPTPRMNLLVRL